MLQNRPQDSQILLDELRQDFARRTRICASQDLVDMGATWFLAAALASANLVKMMV